MKKTVFVLLSITVTAGCIQKFQPRLSSPLTGYLVVEAIINSGGGSSSITLSRTTNLNDSTMSYESGALVQVEGTDSSVHPFTEQPNGVYGTTQLNLDTALEYRLRIKTTANEEYLSDFVPVKTTPPIDSINWQLVNGGVQVYVNTHDPHNNTLYYKWDYVETWEFHSPFPKELNYDSFYVNGVQYLNVANYSPGIADSSIYTCWQTDQSPYILLASSAALSTDVIADFPLILIPQSSIKLTAEYSIVVNQYALTPDAYKFLQTMKTSTEETGSVFSPQPSQLQGNVHCLTKPAETVVGYVSFCTFQSERIFIYNSQLPILWSQYSSGCIQDSIYVLDPKNADYPQNEIIGAILGGLLPTTSININRFLAAPAICVDCTLSGSNQKPSFWQ
jgi:hypothetical protein